MFPPKGCGSGLLHRLEEVNSMANSKKARPDGGASGRVPGCDTAGQQSHEKYNTRQKQKTSIFDMLPVGAECAISRRTLVALTGLSDRQLRYKISQERKAGALILSTTEGGGGYYRAASADELRRYVQSMRSRSKETLAVIRKAEMILQQGDIDQ